MPAGATVGVRWAQDHHFLLATLAPDLVAGILLEAVEGRPVGLVERHGCDDPHARHLLLALWADVAGGRPSGRLYTDTLVRALVLRLLAGYADRRPGEMALSTIRRVREYIEAHLAKNPSLADLADLAGMMRALQIDHYADHPTARLADAPVVAPGNGEVRVRIEAAGLNPLDVKLAQGHLKEWFPISFPYVLGTDFAGVIEEIGHSVEDFRPGDAVFGRAEPTAGGALAEAVTLSVNLIAHRPAGLDAASAAGLPTPAGVAYQALSEVLNRPAGSKLLILGAGAVAHAAVQFARDLGGVTVCGRGAERLRDLGIDVIEPSSPELATVAASSSFVLDTAGANLQATVISLLRPGTHVAAIVNPVDAEVAKSSTITADYVVLATRQATLTPPVGKSPTSR
jgi:NADPH2:quinone reductase